MSFSSSINLSSLNGTKGFRLDGIGAYDQSGYSVASAGDVNGDGYADLIVGALGTNGRVGSSYVVFGKASGFASSINLSSLNGTTGFRLEGVQGGVHSGWSVASAGDVNGDGFADIIVGARGTIGIVGSTYVVFGKASGWGANIELSSLNGTNGFRFDCVTDSDWPSISVASAGDINGDGIADIIVGAPFVNNNTGSSYVIFGKSGSWASTATIDLLALDGSNGFRLDGASGGDRSGVSVASAGDVNGDGIADLIIGAVAADPNGLRA